MKNLGKEKDIQESQSISEGGRGGTFLKLDQAINFMVIVDPDYVDGFSHFVRSGRNVRSIPCKGGLDGRGFAPDDCPLCEDVLAGYDEAKKLLKRGDKAEAKLAKEEANSLHASYQMFTRAIKGDSIVVRKGGRKETQPDFEDVEKVGIWALSNSQKKLLLGLIDDPDYPKIESGDDLVGVVLKVVREKTGNKKVTDIIPVGKLNLDKIDVIDSSNLPEIESLIEIPEDYEDAIEKLEESLTSSETEEEEEKDEDDVELPKPKSSERRRRRR